MRIRRLAVFVPVSCLVLFLSRLLHYHNLISVKLDQIRNDELRSQKVELFSVPRPIRSNEPTLAWNETSAFFSACLLTMDDNHFLPEWLSYHYHVLPLRHVVVAVDPDSKTSPDAIFDRFRKHGMLIEEWSDDVILEGEEIEEPPKRKGQLNVYRVNRHRHRQKLFFAKCMRSLQARNRTWTLMIDTDEYLLLNKNYQHQQEETTSVAVPSVIWNYLQTHEFASPCIQIPRLRFGAVPSPPQRVDRLVPHPMRGEMFTTMRWRHHAPRSNININKVGKTIIDLSRVNASDILPIGKIHRPITAVCSQRGMYTKNEDSPFVIHHYLGSWEQYKFRDDARGGKIRNRKSFDDHASIRGGVDDSIRPWLEGFVGTYGLRTALELLKDVGVVANVTV